MAMRALLCVPVAAVGMIGAALSPGTAWAAPECLAEPSRDPPAGMHWYYRYDRVNDRKCWYMRTLIGAPEASGVEPPRIVLRTPEVPRAAIHPAPAVEAPRATFRPASLPETQRRRQPMSESDEAALYLEFLRWKEQQRTTQ
jgi:hypothetical protein